MPGGSPDSSGRGDAGPGTIAASAPESTPPQPPGEPLRREADPDLRAEPTQLAVVATALGAGIIESRVAFALILGAVMIDVMTPLRRIVAAQMATAEQILDQSE